MKQPWSLFRRRPTEAGRHHEQDTEDEAQRRRELAEARSSSEDLARRLWALEYEQTLYRRRRYGRRVDDDDNEPR